MSKKYFKGQKVWIKFRKLKDGWIIAPSEVVVTKENYQVGGSEYVKISVNDVPWDMKINDVYSAKKEALDAISVPENLKYQKDFVNEFELSLEDGFSMLVYADWCEENNWTDRAEVLRYQAKFLN